MYILKTNYSIAICHNALVRLIGASHGMLVSVLKQRSLSKYYFSFQCIRFAVFVAHNHIRREPIGDSFLRVDNENVPNSLRPNHN